MNQGWEGKALQTLKIVVAYLVKGYIYHVQNILFHHFGFMQMFLASTWSQLSRHVVLGKHPRHVISLFTQNNVLALYTHIEERIQYTHAEMRFIRCDGWIRPGYLLKVNAASCRCILSLCLLFYLLISLAHFPQTQVRVVEHRPGATLHKQHTYFLQPGCHYANSWGLRFRWLASNDSLPRNYSLTAVENASVSTIKSMF